jgi:hypothetical protein
MVYLKSICVGLAFVLCGFFLIFLLMGIVMQLVAAIQGRNDDEAFFISLHSPILWSSVLVFFGGGYFWAYRRLSTAEKRRQKITP